MTELTDDQVKALLDGATPGPWRADGEPWNRVVWSSADNRVCFMAHSNGLNDERDTATSNLVAAAPDLARALLAARAELARVKADAAVAVAEAIRRAAENKEQLDIWAQEILEGLSFADVLKITSYDDKIEAHNMIGRGLVDVILNLAPADGLAAVEALRVEARENAMQALASMGQAQEAYEAQLEAEAELARLRDRERVLVEAATPYVQPVQNADYGRQLRQHEALVAALAQTLTDPGDGWTWNERLGWIGPDGKPAARGGA